MTSADLIGLRTAHLGLIQGVISRMSGFSAAAKNFAVTVAVAIVAVAYDKDVPALLWAGMVATAVFLLMDGYYHLLEVRFRELYRATAARPFDPPSDMLLDAPKASAANVLKVVKSVALLPFYLLLLLALFIAVEEIPDEQANPASTRRAAGAPREEPSTAKRIGQPVGPTQSNVERTLGPPGNAAAAKVERTGNVQ